MGIMVLEREIIVIIVITIILVFIIMVIDTDNIGHIAECDLGVSTAMARSTGRGYLVVYA